jgi:hypothetical protein
MATKFILPFFAGTVMLIHLMKSELLLEALRPCSQWKDCFSEITFHAIFVLYSGAVCSCLRCACMSGCPTQAYAPAAPTRTRAPATRTWAKLSNQTCLQRQVSFLQSLACPGKPLTHWLQRWCALEQTALTHRRRRS